MKTKIIIAVVALVIITAIAFVVHHYHKKKVSEAWRNAMIQASDDAYFMAFQKWANDNYALGLNETGARDEKTMSAYLGKYGEEYVQILDKTPFKSGF